MARSRVFVVQQHLRRNDSGVLVPKHDLTPAAKFGELVYVMRAEDNPTDGSDILGRMRRVLKDITPDDYILPIGSTVLMVLVGVIAAEYQAKLNFLYWNGKDRDYRVTAIDLDAC